VKKNVPVEGVLTKELSVWKLSQKEREEDPSLVTFMMEILEAAPIPHASKWKEVMVRFIYFLRSSCELPT
jgi:hypothetical protein